MAYLNTQQANLPVSSLHHLLCAQRQARKLEMILFISLVSFHKIIEIRSTGGKVDALTAECCLSQQFSLDNLTISSFFINHFLIDKKRHQIG